MIMKAKKQIKKKLNELNEIPEGFHFDQEETWKRLEVRMDLDSTPRGPNWLRYPFLWFTRLTRAISRLVSRDFPPKPNRRRNRKRLYAKKYRNI